MRSRVVVRLVGSVLLVAATTVLVLQVRVGGPGDAGRFCGSALDVITDRADWQSWFAQDSIDPPAAPASPLLRTLHCPGAVNARNAVAGGLAAAGLVTLSLRRLADRRQRPMVSTTSALNGLRRVGWVVSAFGAALAFAGLIALGLLTAKSDATLFLFVNRGVVFVLGLVLLTPLFALIAGGWVLAHLGGPAREVG